MKRRVGERKKGQKKKIPGKFESTKWLYLQTRGWCGKMRRCIGMKVLYCFFVVVVVVFMW